MYFTRVIFQAIIFVSFSLVCGAIDARAERKLALVVGIDKYPNLPANRQLIKAVNDSRAVAAALKDIGFSVTPLENPNRLEMSRALGALESAISNDDTVFVFFAGHGIEIAGANYLLPGDIPSPIDAQNRRLPTRAFRDSSFNAAEMLSSFQRQGAKTVVAVFDACREAFDDEGTRSLGLTRGGLAEMRGANGTFVIFSAGAKQLALDRLAPNDPDPNSVFTRTLVPLLKIPGQSIQRLAKELQPKVRTLAASVDHVQTPAYYDEIVGDFYLVPGEATASLRTERAPEFRPPPPDPCAGVAEHWRATESIGSRAAFEGHMARFPSCAFADLARMRIAALTVPAVPPAPPVASSPQPSRSDPADASVCRAPGSMWDVGGSRVILKADPNLPVRKFYFCQPGGTARSEGAKAGNLLFTGQRNGNRYQGTAYVHSSRCGSRSYSVSGSVVNGDRGVVFSGQRPFFDDSCGVTYRETQSSLSYQERL